MAPRWRYSGPMSSTLQTPTTRGPKINLRFGSKKELQDVRRAASRKGMSINRYVREMLKVAVKETVNGDQR